MEVDANVEALQNIHHKFSQLSKSQPHRSIDRVYKHLRSINTKAYEPEIVAIGPYHRRKEILKMMEEHKLRYLESLLHRRNQNLERYVSAVAHLEHEARGCFVEPIGLSIAKFIEMLVLDGCFIIEVIRRFHHRDSTCKNDPIFQIKWIMKSLQRDFTLFENQIPFFVLCRLFDLIESPNQHNRLIQLALFFFQSLSPGPTYEHRAKRFSSSREVKHLLDLIHSHWQRPTSENEVSIDVDDSVPIERESRFIHSATELKEANVRFRKRKSNALFDVEFKNGVVLMASLIIEDRTECLLRNLIAHEQYDPGNHPTPVTDYARLMDCLINSSKDVEILSQCGIIDNLLGDNQVVAHIFNQLTDLVTGPEKHFVYGETCRRINAHYKKRWNRAMAVLNREYFASPWAYVSFLGAVLLLLLTAAQTLCSVLQLVN